MWRGLLVMLILAGVARAQAPAAPKMTAERLKAILDAVRAKHRIPAMAAAIVTSDGIKVWSMQGVRKIGTKVAVEEHDRWHLGSDTKAFTGTLLGILAEKGKFDYDLTLAKAFPALAKGMQADYKEATLDQVLRHRAGLPSNLSGTGGWWAIQTTLPIRVQRIQAVRRGLNMKPVAEPGKKYSYSNLGYVVAAALAERNTDDTWESLIEKHIFKPLEIKNYGFGPPGTVGKLDQPMLHDGKGRPVEPTLKADNPPVMGPSGRLHLSLGDWAKFVQEHLRGAQGKGKLMKAESYKRLHSAPEGESYSPGGWIVEPVSATAKLLTHDGSNGGGFATVAIIPSADAAVLVVCNHGPKPGEAASKEALLTILKEALGGG